MNKKVLYIIYALIFLITVVSASAENWRIAGGSTTGSNFSVVMNQGFYYQYFSNQSNLTVTTSTGCGAMSTFWGVDALCNIPVLGNRSDFSEYATNKFLWMHPLNASEGAQVSFIAPRNSEYSINASFYKTTGGNNVNFYIRQGSKTGAIIYYGNLSGADRRFTINNTNMTAGEKLLIYVTTDDSNGGDSSGLMLNITSRILVSPTFNVTITLKDNFNNYVSNFTTEINSVNYTTTNGTAVTNLLTNTTTLYTVKIFNPQNNFGGLFNRTYTNVNISLLNFQANTTQTEIRFTARERETNNTLSGMFYLENGTTIYNSSLATPWNAEPGTYNFAFNKTDYIGQTSPGNVINALQNNTITIYNVYSSIVWLNVTNAFSGQMVNFTGSATNINNGFVQVIGASDGNLIGVELLRNNNYTFFIDVPGYALGSENYLNYTPRIEEPQINFSVYTNNSVRLRIYDIVTNALVTENISVTFAGPVGDTIIYTTNGTVNIDNLTDGNYSVSLISISANYSSVSYLITVADRSTQLLNAYMTANALTSIFTVQDSTSGQVIESATISQSKLINGTFVLVETKLTDISGRAQVSYLTGASYRFTVSKTNYQTKLFDLNPILFATYTVNLDRTTQQNNTAQLSDVSLSYTPKVVQAFTNNSIIIIITSPNGVLEDYLINVTWNNTGQRYFGSNAYGEYINVTLNITNASIGSKARLYIEYNTTLGNRFNFTYYLPVEGGYTGTNTFEELRNKDYGLGWLERVLIATGIIIIVAGMVFLIAGGLSALGIGVLLMGFFMYINFIPLWGLLISAFVGIILLSRQQGA